VGSFYDPFLGSGTAIIAATNLACVCYAMEIEPRFVQQSIGRWQAFSGETAARIDRHDDQIVGETARSSRGGSH
jgi:DNA modification methylase